MKNDQRLSCHRILKHFGIDTQTDKLVEELDELDEAIRVGTESDIIGELADVEIMLEQCKEGLSYHDKVSAMIDHKIDRTNERIGNNYYEKYKCDHCGNTEDVILSYKCKVCNVGSMIELRICQRAEYLLKPKDINTVNKMIDTVEEAIARKRLKKLTNDHWSYIDELLRTHDVSDEKITLVEFHYKTAFEHGYKHAKEELS